MIKQLKNTISQNKEEGVELLFKSYSESLSQYAKRQWKVEEDLIWDIVYKSIYKLVDVLQEKDFEHEAQLKSYLFRTFINYLKNALRDQNTKQQGLTQVDLTGQEEKQAVQEETSNPQLVQLNAVLDELEDWKRILLLLRNQGVSYAEISKLVNMPEKNLKVYYGRLKAEVKQRLESMNKKIESHG